LRYVGTRRFERISFRHAFGLVFRHQRIKSGSNLVSRSRYVGLTSTPLHLADLVCKFFLSKTFGTFLQGLLTHSSGYVDAATTEASCCFRSRSVKHTLDVFFGEYVSGLFANVALASNLRNFLCTTRKKLLTNLTRGFFSRSLSGLSFGFKFDGFFANFFGQLLA
jgi:hypothetical protein